MNIKTKKRLSILLAIILICFLLFLAMGFTGNPLSKFLVTINSKKYIQENYNNLENLKTEVNYNFKTGGYSVLVEKINSKDIKFYLEYDLLGRLKYDEYEDLVVKKLNTVMRMQNEYSDYLESKIKLNTYEEINYIVLDVILNDDDFKDFKIDESLDINKMRKYETNLSISVDAKERELTEENIKKFLQEIIKQNNNKEIDIDTYTIYYDRYKQENDKKIYVDGIFVERIPKDSLNNLEKYIID